MFDLCQTKPQSKSQRGKAGFIIGLNDLGHAICSAKAKYLPQQSCAGFAFDPLKCHAGACTGIDAAKNANGFAVDVGYLR